MDGGITRQSEQYGIFDNTPRPERTAREAAPESVIREYTRGRSVGDGQLNPGNRRHAVNTYGMDPENHAYHEEPGEGRGAYSWGRNRREWDEGQERQHELAGEDDLSGYNWGPEPSYDPGAEPGPHPEFGGDRPHPMGTPIYNPRSSPYDKFTGSRLGFNRRGQGLMTHMFTPGSRVGLPYNGDVIPGIVHQLHPDSEVGVRWADGQYTKESPGDVFPL